ncbi:FtsW/RodA/SpoVE family cell cycle protein, partial [Candidatus Berkelbacteria bacterium]|nr:FtsW/RodA/SpoVE family cell cycle protein [Candidatus Berkelbacteria bacterium]
MALAVLSLALFGVLMILSASAYLAGTSGNIYSFVTKQLLSLGLGLVLMGVFSQLDYRHWRVWAGTMLAAVILLLLAVLLSSPIRDVHRWVQLGSVHFQPAEFVPRPRVPDHDPPSHGGRDVAAVPRCLELGQISRA